MNPLAIVANVRPKIVVLHFKTSARNEDGMATSSPVHGVDDIAKKSLRQATAHGGRILLEWSGSVRTRFVLTY